MADYRIRVRLRAPLATPMHSGTLFGHLCWALRDLRGEQALEEWLQSCQEPPLLLSDAFPVGYLARPLLAPEARPAPVGGAQRRAFIERLEKEKLLRKRASMAVEDFLALRGGLSEHSLLQRLAQGSYDTGRVERLRVAHNTINRHTGTTPAAGGLYFVQETWHDLQASELDVYVRTHLAADDLETLFAHVGEQGFGRDASLGRGRFSAQVNVADAALFQHSGNRLLSLSHGVLSPNMAEPRYRLHTHYGKLGGLYATGPRSPFKYPVRLMRPGATFAPADSGPYGALLEGVHPHHHEIRHYGWHLCLPYTET
jgi:CRISPR-associated protein Csm4